VAVARAGARTVVAALACTAALAGAAGRARADDDFAGATVIFARGSSLYRIDPSGRGETAIAQLAARTTVRALRTDAAGRVLLADLAGKWAWMPLDGSSGSLSDLPCADGPAQLAEDGSSVLCRSTTAANQSIIIELAAGRRAVPPGAPPRPVAIDVPPATARLTGAGAERTLVWADATGVWTALETDPKHKTRVAPDAPLRGFLASPDGERAIGVYADQIYSDVRHTRPGEQLMTLQLDGQGARRKAIRDGVAVEWSHDSEWVLVQDGASACIMRASGGQYKCWKGYTAASLSSDGRWGLVLGNRDGSRKQTSVKPAKATRAGAKTRKPAKPASPASRSTPARPAGPAGDDDPGDMPWDHIDEPSDEAEAGEPQADQSPSSNDDVNVAPPGGPLSLFRIRLEGAFTDRPALLAKVVDGAAVWIPRL